MYICDRHHVRTYNVNKWQKWKKVLCVFTTVLFCEYHERFWFIPTSTRNQSIKGYLLF